MVRFPCFFILCFHYTQKGQHTLDCVRVYRTCEETLDFTFHYIPTTEWGIHSCGSDVSIPFRNRVHAILAMTTTSLFA